ncbi:hypothetical protein [Solitalea canadensis]|uniref:hypothetical protein n=1 Tax=Solitalea canadensis TaxID=995 RepID=UPI0002F3D776|nr:hypothetical protein [Solitalea canadensis]
MGCRTVAPTCTFQCENVTIQGPAEFCVNAQYSIANLPSDVNVYWSTNGSVDVKGTSNQPTVTLEKS